MKNVIGGTLFVIAGLIVGSVSTAAQDLDRFSWKGPIGEAGVLRVENPFGDVRLRHGGDTGEVEVAAVMQQLRQDGIHLETQAFESDGALVVTVVWASKPGVEAPERPEDDRSRADLAVLVPRGSKIVVDAPNGLVETRGVHGDADLQTSTGDIRIHKHFGAVSASSETGSIQAVLLTGETDKAQVFQSVTGSIEIWVNANAKHQAVVTTSGSITTDFTMEISHRDNEEPDKIGKAVLGDGGPELRLISRRGSLALRRVAIARKTTE
ncbi:MAG: hypothetical protein DRJ65_22850 [Acidobacteria bacterium]|nr:MAG: hypothetical protein DRJ65_22850 [Acidobacteriota bacterium]